MTIKPITPQEVSEQKIKNIPDNVINCWNKAIVRNCKGGGSYATIFQSEIVGLLADAMEVSREEVFASDWLDIEPIYRAAGWKVEYDKPGYNETYVAYYTFNKKS
jgi:hypothetical protein